MIRLKANAVLEREIEQQLTRPVGRPWHKPRCFITASHIRRNLGISHVAWHAVELFPRVGFIVTNLTNHSKNVVKFYNDRGTTEQWIKEGKNAVSREHYALLAAGRQPVRTGRRLRSGTGFELPPVFQGETPQRGESGADGARQAPHGPQLATVIAAWHTLPDAVKAGILAMVKATHGGNFTSALTEAASYQKTDGTIVDPIWTSWDPNIHPYTGPNLEPSTNLTDAYLFNANLTSVSSGGITGIPRAVDWVSKVAVASRLLRIKFRRVFGTVILSLPFS